MEIISRHVFTFPFSWQHVSKKKRYSGLYTKDEKDILHLLSEEWCKIEREITSYKAYNEKVYFYKPVQSILYEATPETIVNVYKSNSITEKAILKVEAMGKKYELDLQDLLLKLYKNGIGLLSFEVVNKKYSKPEDVLAINGMSKAIYPYMLPLEKVWEDYFPKRIEIISEKLTIVETFQEDYMEKAPPVASFIMALLGKGFVCEEKKLDRQHLYIETLFSNRMFTLCLYYNKNFLQKVKTDQIEEGYFRRFIAFTKEEKKFNVKTVELSHTLYGIGRFSLVGVTAGEEEVRLYNQLVTLAILQKASLLYFSNQIVYISTLPKEKLVGAMGKLYEVYIQFVNQMYFREVTVDVQGSHLYDLLREALMIEEELHELDFEMREVHEYSGLIQNRQSKLRMDLLTVGGSILVIPTFVTGFFGMNILQDRFTTWWVHGDVGLFLNSYMLLPILVVLFICSIWTGHQYKKVIRLTLGICILLSLLLLIIKGCGLGYR